MANNEDGHLNPDAALIDERTKWTIDLQDCAAQGVNLANVNTIATSISDFPDSTDTVFLWDIDALYRHRGLHTSMGVAARRMNAL